MSVVVETLNDVHGSDSICEDNWAGVYAHASPRALRYLLMSVNISHLEDELLLRFWCLTENSCVWYIKYKHMLDVEQCMVKKA